MCHRFLYAEHVAQEGEPKKMGERRWQFWSDSSLVTCAEIEPGKRAKNGQDERGFPAGNSLENHFQVVQ